MDLHPSQGAHTSHLRTLSKILIRPGFASGCPRAFRPREPRIIHLDPGSSTSNRTWLFDRRQTVSNPAGLGAPADVIFTPPRPAGRPPAGQLRLASSPPNLQRTPTNVFALARDAPIPLAARRF